MNALALQIAFALTERGWMPDAAIRAGIRKLCRKRLEQEAAHNPQLAQERLGLLLDRCRQGPIAPVPEKANEQHYELPADFFRLVLGSACKYSSCYWRDETPTLDDAEQLSLQITCQHADLADGQEVLELGCGWGSLTLYMAGKFPASRITAVSNSAPQRRFILDRAQQRGLSNIRVITADMNQFDTDQRYDRVVSVEMFEHMRNYQTLMQHIARWLRDDGRLFVHVFCHRRLAYEFETTGPADWMGRHFFTGGIMPSANLLTQFDQHMNVSERWLWPGTHYEKTANAWLVNMDRQHEQIMPILREVYGRDAKPWWHRWRVFFMACAELFGYDRGNQWAVAHYRFQPVRRVAGIGSPQKEQTSCATP